MNIYSQFYNITAPAGINNWKSYFIVDKENIDANKINNFFNMTPQNMNTTHAVLNALKTGTWFSVCP